MSRYIFSLSQSVKIFVQIIFNLIKIRPYIRLYFDYVCICIYVYEDVMRSPWQHFCITKATAFDIYL